MALVEIRDSRLYREECETFEEYCKERWELGRNYANKMIASASVVKRLGTNVPIPPANEAQVRPLTKLETAEAQQEAWGTAVEVEQKNHQKKIHL